MRKVQTRLWKRRKEEHATNVESMNISHKSAKMEHDEVQHVVAAEAEEETQRRQRNFRQQGASTCERCGKGANAWIANRLRNNEIEWLLDSGCSDHIINNENYFENCIKLKEPVNIYLGDNRS